MEKSLYDLPAINSSSTSAVAGSFTLRDTAGVVM
jgi:hypothetical protein